LSAARRPGPARGEAGREDGFIDRILFSWPEPVPYGWTDAEPDRASQEAYAEFFQKLLALDMLADPGTGEARPRVLGWTDSGRRPWVDYVNRLAADLNSGAHPPALRGPWAKMEGYGARLALVLHVCHFTAGETTEVDVDERSVRGATRLAEYFQAHARRVYDRLSPQPRSYNPDGQAVLDWVHRRRGELASLNPPRFSWRQIRRDLHNRFTARPEDLRKALRELEEASCLRAMVAPQCGFGRPPEPEYWVHPALVEANPSSPAF
jgi:hypothetical protein